ncbi:PD-(D/E)XK motif protein [Streptomyces griseorubiginosus]|uniref:PD-(D/E)XK motif protein n=1 Tax=Streptomyces griseorubiginosus TaxID=67304 RepID=UPI00114060B4|nr:PD-(D/E)XK motif protein [Streptomyces griseorubiginosus]
MTDGRYVPWTEVEYYLGKGQATVFPLSDPSSHPEVSYVVGHGGQEIALHVELDRRHRPPRSSMTSIRIDQIAERGIRLARIRTTQVTLMRDFHDFLSAIADRIVTQGRNLDQAYAETIRAWNALLNRPHGFSTEKRIGLMGELAVLNGFAHEYGWTTAVEAWTGPEGEEHDFGLPEFDFEVKTTASEQRRHTIHGVGQLTPTPDRPLWFASLQLTRGGSNGRTLADCVSSVRASVAEHAPASLLRLDSKLAASGWSDDLPDDERWTPRAKPLVLDASAVPRLDPTLLPESVSERISNIQYTIDVTGLLPTLAPPSTALNEFRLP